MEEDHQRWVPSVLQQSVPSIGDRQHSEEPLLQLVECSVWLRQLVEELPAERVQVVLDGPVQVVVVVVVMVFQPSSHLLVAAQVTPFAMTLLPVVTHPTFGLVIQGYFGRQTIHRHHHLCSPGTVPLRWVLSPLAIEPTLNHSIWCPQSRNFSVVDRFPSADKRMNEQIRSQNIIKEIFQNNIC